MSADTVSTRDLFHSLEGRVFVSYQEFDSAVREALGRYRAAFPLAYTPHQAIAWARENGWVTDTDEGLTVEVRSA